MAKLVCVLTSKRVGVIVNAIRETVKHEDDDPLLYEVPQEWRAALRTVDRRCMFRLMKELTGGGAIPSPASVYTQLKVVVQEIEKGELSLLTEGEPYPEYRIFADDTYAVLGTTIRAERLERDEA